MQAPSSRIPPIRAATVASDLYKPCACLRAHYSAEGLSRATGNFVPADHAGTTSLDWVAKK